MNLELGEYVCLHLADQVGCKGITSLYEFVESNLIFPDEVNFMEMIR